MIRTEVTLSLTKPGQETLRKMLEDTDYAKRGDKAFADVTAFLDSATTLAETKDCVVLRFDELAAGWAELDALKTALVGLADQMHPYQALFKDDYGTQSDSYGQPQTYDVVLPGERLDYDIFDDDFEDAIAKATPCVDIALQEVYGNQGLDRHEAQELMRVLTDKWFEPISIDAKEHECSAMGFVSTHTAVALDFDYDRLRDFVASILDDMENESEDGLYDFDGHKLLLTRR